jgi:hypothetical protein
MWLRRRSAASIKLRIFSCGRPKALCISPSWQHHTTAEKTQFSLPQKETFNIIAEKSQDCGTTVRHFGSGYFA